MNIYFCKLISFNLRVVDEKLEPDHWMDKKICYQLDSVRNLWSTKTGKSQSEKCRKQEYREMSGLTKTNLVAPDVN
jgi:hypothetical protein